MQNNQKKWGGEALDIINKQKTFKNQQSPKLIFRKD